MGTLCHQCLEPNSSLPMFKIHNRFICEICKKNNITKKLSMGLLLLEMERLIQRDLAESFETSLLLLLKYNLSELPKMKFQNINEDMTSFMKAFRQMDIIDGDNGNTDAVIYNLLQSSQYFRKAYIKITGFISPFQEEREYGLLCKTLKEKS